MSKTKKRKHFGTQPTYKTTKVQKGTFIFLNTQVRNREREGIFFSSKKFKFLR